MRLGTDCLQTVSVTVSEQKRVHPFRDKPLNLLASPSGFEPLLTA